MHPSKQNTMETKEIKEDKETKEEVKPTKKRKYLGDDWRTIPGYSGYQMSKTGEAWGGVKQDILKMNEAASSYSVKADGDTKNKNVARSVLLALTWPELKDDGANWKPIDGHPNYQVSDRGGVRNAKTLTLLKPQKSGDIENAYLSVELTGGKAYSIHRLVLAAFGPAQPSKIHTVDHGDFDKPHNTVTNLSWKTPKEQAEHAAAAGETSTLKGA